VLDALAIAAARRTSCPDSRRRSRARPQTYSHAAALLETVNLPDHTLPAKRRRVLASKDNVHYSPRLISKTDAQALVRQARVLVDAAERL
jgi:hypothetical protein